MKSYTKLLAIIVCLSTIHSGAAFGQGRRGKGEGPGSGNGGNVAVSQDVAQFLDLVRLPDTVSYVPKDYSAYNVLLGYLEKHPGYQKGTFFPQVRPTTPLIVEIMKTLDSMSFYLVNRNLPPLKDTGIVELPWNFDGRTERLALQERENRTVIINRYWFEKLLQRGNEDVAAFLLHEVLIAIWNREHFFGNLEATDKIANVVNLTFGKDPIVKVLSPRVVSEMMCKAEIWVAEDRILGLKPKSDFLIRGARYDNFYMFFENNCRIYKFKALSQWEINQESPKHYQDVMMIEAQFKDGSTSQVKLWRYHWEGREPYLGSMQFNPAHSDQELKEAYASTWWDLKGKFRVLIKP
jgi:hypothetical protein